MIEALNEIWPANVGLQRLAFNFAATAFIGHKLLNIYSAIRQNLPITRMFFGLFTGIGLKNMVEKIISLVLLTVLWCSFLVLIIDALVNGIQLQ